MAKYGSERTAYAKSINASDTSKMRLSFSRSTLLVAYATITSKLASACSTQITNRKISTASVTVFDTI
uniref:Uncharacterized protein n=1 Tax=Ascaris lumbricoides TaxID=6252 RepID=A0A9J2Q2V4_ASCLU